MSHGLSANFQSHFMRELLCGQESVQITEIRDKAKTRETSEENLWKLLALLSPEKKVKNECFSYFPVTGLGFVVSLMK